MSEWISYKDLDSKDKKNIIELAHKEFGASKFLENFEAAEPDFTNLVKKDNQLIGFIHAVSRTGSISEKFIKIGGLMNLIILPAYRKKGLGKNLFEQALDFLKNQLGVDVYIGFPAEEWLYHYYEQLGCKTALLEFKALSKRGYITGSYKASYKIFNQHLELNKKHLIDLNGKPW